MQTEDLGYVTSSPALQYQAEFENLRRWLSLDLLSGRVTPEHGLWTYLCRSGASVDELQELVESPCTPDIVGVNAYLTSERHLDARVHLYPPELAGSNGRHRFGDIESVRVSGTPNGGFQDRLREVGERSDLPTAMTAVHLGCTREEQLRWLSQAWHAALRCAMKDTIYAP